MKLLWLIPFLFICANVRADTYQVDFAFPETAKVDGFNFYQLVDEAGVQITSVPPDARTFTFEADTLTSGCRTYYMSAYKSGINGPPSEGYGVCYEYPLPLPVEGPTEMVYELRIKRIP